MSSTVQSVTGKSRLLSPKSRSTEPFQGQLIVLDNANTMTQMQQVRSALVEKPAKRPPSGSLEVLRSEKNTMKYNGEDKQTEIKRPGSGRREQKIPEFKRKEECLCQDETVCDLCHNLKVEDLKMHYKEVKNLDLKIQKCKAEKIPTEKSSFMSSPAQIIVANTNEEEEGDISSEDSGNNQDGNGSTNNSQGFSLTEASKAPLELLGRFLSAVMEKDFKEAQILCDEILTIEPDNATCLEFKRTLEEKLDQDAAESSSESDEESNEEENEDSSENSDEESDEEDSSENEENAESDEDFDVSKLNLLLGGLAIRK